VEHGQLWIRRQAMCRAQPVQLRLGDLPRRGVPGAIPEAEERTAGHMRETQHLGGHAPAELQWIADKDVKRPRLGDSQHIGHHPRRQEPGEHITDP
jgi:hypothetical protein